MNSKCLHRPCSVRSRDYAELLNPKSQLDKTKGAELPHKKLSDIMKIELLENKTADEIKQIWFEYHSKKDVLVAAIPTATYNLLSARGKQYPMFIFPLPRSQGYEFFLLQFASNTVHFTPLLCYQVCTNLTFHIHMKLKNENQTSNEKNNPVSITGSQRERSRMSERGSLH